MAEPASIFCRAALERFRETCRLSVVGGRVNRWLVIAETVRDPADAAKVLAEWLTGENGRPSVDEARARVFAPGALVEAVEVAGRAWGGAAERDRTRDCPVPVVMRRDLPRPVPLLVEFRPTGSAEITWPVIGEIRDPPICRAVATAMLDRAWAPGDSFALDGTVELPKPGPGILEVGEAAAKAGAVLNVVSVIAGLATLAVFLWWARK
jgi:hypothetical protein